jgi:hypothetical protein
LQQRINSIDGDELWLKENQADVNQVGENEHRPDGQEPAAAEESPVAHELEVAKAELAEQELAQRELKVGPKPGLVAAHEKRVAVEVELAAPHVLEPPLPPEALAQRDDCPKEKNVAQPEHRAYPKVELQAVSEKIWIKPVQADQVVVLDQ